jgi:endoglucanase
LATALRVKIVAVENCDARALFQVTTATLFLTALVGMFLGSQSVASSEDADAFAYNRLLGRGMNIGNALEAPSEGAWGVTLKPEYFQAIQDAGFNSVRIPIRWSAHALPEPPYTISPAFFARVDWAIDQALSRKLTAVIDMHHYGEMDQDPVQKAPRLIALWKQIATRYQGRPQALYFELFNEPEDKFTDSLWNEIFPKLLQTIREDNPKRMVIIGPGYWNTFYHLPYLELPQDDRRLIVTFHYYEPMHFTHQAQSWLPGSQAWKGTGWGTAQERDELHENFEKADAWARHNQRPLYLGEFGSSENADIEARVAWTQAVTREAEKLGFSWSYFQFCSNFGVYDTTTRTWNQPLLQTLLDRN